MSQVPDEFDTVKPNGSGEDDLGQAAGQSSRAEVEAARNEADVFRAECDVLRDERDSLQKDRDALFERLARATADFQNSRKRLEADKTQAIAFANTTLIKALLPVLDNFERALAVEPAKTDVATLLKGMQIVHDQLIKALRAQSVEEIAPEPGTTFDPATMEALMHQPSDTFPDHTVVQVVQKGYQMLGRMLRPAHVIVSKGPG